jgi:hypothetical protein
MRGLLQLLLLSIGAESAVVHAASNQALAAAEALLLHDAATNHTYLHDNGNRFRYFISVAGSDLPPATMAHLQPTGLTFLPGSSWKKPANGEHVTHDMRLNIGEPRPLPDGSFQIDYSFYCGARCASGNNAILRHDDSGWHVMATRLKTIS